MSRSRRHLRNRWRRQAASMRGQGLNDLPRCELERRSSHHKGIFFEVPIYLLFIFQQAFVKQKNESPCGCLVSQPDGSYGQCGGRCWGRGRRRTYGRSLPPCIQPCDDHARHHRLLLDIEAGMGQGAESIGQSLEPIMEQRPRLGLAHWPLQADLEHRGLEQLTCLIRSAISTLRSRQSRRRSSSSASGALTIVHTRGSPRLYASSVRTSASP